MSRSARGFAMVAVIGLLVVLAILGTSLVVISNTQHVGAAMDLQGIRAYHAARAGLEWGAFHVLRPGLACGGVNGQVLQFPGLDDFRVVLSCASTSHDDEGGNVAIAVVQARACNAAAPCSPAAPPAGYVERELRITLAR